MTLNICIYSGSSGHHDFVPGPLFRCCKMALHWLIFIILLLIFSAFSSNLFFPLSSETLFPWLIFNSAYSITGFSTDFSKFCLRQVCLYLIRLSMNTVKHHQFSAGDWTQGLPHTRQALYYWTPARVCQFYGYHCLSCLNYYNSFQHLFFQHIILLRKMRYS